MHYCLLLVWVNLLGPSLSGHLSLHHELGPLVKPHHLDHLHLPGVRLLLGGGRQHGGALLLLPLHRLDSSLVGLISQTLGKARV